MPDFVSPVNDVIVLMGIAFFNILQETLHHFAPGREDGKADHDEKDPLEDGKKEAKNPKPDQYPANDPESDLFKFVHKRGCLKVVL